MHIDEKFRLYHELLLKWQEKINLISPSTIPHAKERHFDDSAQLAALLPDTACHLFDIGSGAGFPGLVLAMLKPQINVTLIESDQKKCSFLKTVSRETKTHVTIVPDRIEQSIVSEIPDIITARALAPIDKLFDYCAPWIEENPALTCVFPKGAQAAAELLTVRKKWDFEFDQHASITDPTATIYVFKAIKKRINN